LLMAALRASITISSMVIIYAGINVVKVLLRARYNFFAGNREKNRRTKQCLQIKIKNNR
jgi:hypothetical protein